MSRLTVPKFTLIQFALWWIYSVYLKTFKHDKQYCKRFWHFNSWTSYIIILIHRKNDFVEVPKNLARSENNFVGLSQ